MKLLIEHNSFHSMGKCLSRNAKDDNDINDFLQICIQTIFADTIYLSNFIPTSIKDLSLERMQLLKSRGFDNIALANDQDKFLWEEVCEKTNKNLLNEMSSLTSHRRKKGSWNNLPELSPELKKVVTGITRAIKSGDEILFVDILKKISQGERNDALIEILTKKGELFYKILELKPLWNEGLTFKMITGSRVIQNHTIAHSQNLLYAPSVKRIREDELFYDNVLSKFNKMLKDYGRERIVGIEMPSISEYLKIKSKGNPERLLDETLELREKSTVIREFLNRNTVSLFTTENEIRRYTINQLNELSQEILNNLPKWEKQKVIGVQHDMYHYTDFSDLADAIANKQYSPQFKCFTEIAYRLSDVNKYNINYGKILKENCIDRN